MPSTVTCHSHFKQSPEWVLLPLLLLVRLWLTLKVGSQWICLACTVHVDLPLVHYHLYHGEVY